MVPPKLCRIICKIIELRTAQPTAAGDTRMECKRLIEKNMKIETHLFWKQSEIHIQLSLIPGTRRIQSQQEAISEAKNFLIYKKIRRWHLLQLEKFMKFKFYKMCMHIASNFIRQKEKNAIRVMWLQNAR